MEEGGEGKVRWENGGAMGPLARAPRGTERHYNNIVNMIFHLSP